MTDATRFTVVLTPDDLARATAQRVADAARAAIDERGIFRIALSGGSTPKSVYPLLLERPVREAVDWSRVEFFWGDERAVPPDHPDSNFGVAYQMLIAHLPDVRPALIHRMQAESEDLDAAALAYEAELRLSFEAAGDEPPRFDLVWLGMGADGHTASLFPGSAGLDEERRWVIGNFADAQQAWRMTLTFPVLRAARQVMFAVSGADKAAAVAAVRAGNRELPAGRVRGETVEWLIDAPAAGETTIG